jgi:hypothetical protein
VSPTASRSKRSRVVKEDERRSAPKCHKVMLENANCLIRHLGRISLAHIFSAGPLSPARGLDSLRRLGLDQTLGTPTSAPTPTSMNMLGGRELQGESRKARYVQQLEMRPFYGPTQQAPARTVTPNSPRHEHLLINLASPSCPPAAMRLFQRQKWQR